MSFYVRLFLQYALTLLAALTINFFLPRLAPGDPILTILPADVVAAMSREEIARVLADYGLDLPLWQQYLNYLAGIASGDFGTSVLRCPPSAPTSSACPRAAGRGTWAWRNGSSCR